MTFLDFHFREPPRDDVTTARVTEKIDPMPAVG
jgi:hypothetical protein